MAAAIRHRLSRVGVWGQWDSYDAFPTLERWVDSQQTLGGISRSLWEDPQNDPSEGN